MASRLDHVVFGCRDLPAGAKALSAEFGAPPGGHGRHAMMGTHNALWNMGDAYIELVAIDPEAAHPGRPRWFGLDDPAVQARLADGPRLLTWAVSTDLLDQMAAAAPVALGPIEAFARDDLTWRTTVPLDGAPGLDGVFPLTIEWTGGVHPARRLPDVGIRCRKLTLSHPAIDRARGALGPVEGPVAFAAGRPAISAALETPAGAVSFDA